MRLIGHLQNESAARTFGDYLFVEGIANRIEAQPPEGWAIWVEDEDKLGEAAKRLTAFRANPSATEFQARAKSAEALRKEQEKKEDAYRKRTVGRRHLFRPLTAYGFGPLTFVLMAASVLVFLLSRFGAEPERVMSLFITNFLVDGSLIRWLPGLAEVRHGEVWRLVTPIFIHMNVLHILFNLLWLRDLGSMIEARQSTVHLALLVLVVAICSNLAQFYLGHNPNFGGMSGVLYGLLGYIWVRGRFDPGSGLYLHPTTVTMMLVWFAVCWMGFLPIANYTHTAGLVLGVAWGYLSSLRYR